MTAEQDRARWDIYRCYGEVPEHLLCSLHCELGESLAVSQMVVWGHDFPIPMRGSVHLVKKGRKLKCRWKRWRWRWRCWTEGMCVLWERDFVKIGMNASRVHGGYEILMKPMYILFHDGLVFLVSSQTL